MFTRGMEEWKKDFIVVCTMFYPLTDLHFIGHPPGERSITVHAGWDEK